MNVDIDDCKSIEEIVELRWKLEEGLEKVGLGDQNLSSSTVFFHNELGLSTKISTPVDR